MRLRGQAKPIVIIIITVIIIFITISRASYYPPPCFLHCQVQGALVPAIQVGHDAKMPYRNERSIYHLAIHVKPASIWKEGFAGWIQRWSMIWIRRLFPRFPFHCQCEIWFLFRKEALQSACAVLRRFCVHMMHTDTPRIMLALQASSVLSTDWGTGSVSETLNRRNLIRCLFEWDPEFDMRSFCKIPSGIRDTLYLPFLSKNYGKVQISQKV